MKYFTKFYVSATDKSLVVSAVPHKFKRSASLCGDSPPNFSQFYEVLFLGKTKTSHKRAPPSFIDDTLAKIKLREAKLQQKQETKENIATETTKHGTICHPLDTTAQGIYDETI